MLKDLFSEITEELNLRSDESLSDIEKEAESEDSGLDPLSAAIYQYLATQPIEKEAEAVAVEPEQHEVTSAKSAPTSLSASLILIEKEAGEMIFPDHIKNFVYNAEKSGFSDEEIEEYLEKQALSAAGGAGLSMLGRALSAPFKGVGRSLAAASAKKKAIKAIMNSEMGPALADNAVADAVRKAGAGIQDAPGLSDRLLGVVSPNRYKNKRIAEELKVKGTLDDLVSMNPSLLDDPTKIRELVKEVSYGSQMSPGLKSYANLKAPDVKTLRPDVLAKLSPAERAAAELAHKAEIFRKGKNFRPAMYGAGGAGLAYLAATRDNSGGGRGRGPIVIT